VNQPHHRAALALLAVTTGFGACGGGDDSSESTSTIAATIATTAPVTTTTTPTTTTPELPSTGNAEVDGLLLRSRTASYHVVYDDGRGTTFEIHRADGRVKLTSGAQAIYQLDGGVNVLCELSEAPTCTSLPAGTGSVDEFLLNTFGLFGSVFSGATSASSPFSDATSITEETIVDRPAKCVAVTLESRAYSLCLDAEIGILLRMTAEQTDGSTSQIIVTTVEVGAVDPTIFDLPAAIT
jgi:hypothetical protein